MIQETTKIQGAAGDRPAATGSAICIGDRVFVLTKQTRRERLAGAPIMGTVVALGKWGVGFVVQKDGHKSTIKLQRHDIAPAPQINGGSIAVRGQSPKFAAAMARMLKRASFDLVTGNIGHDLVCPHCGHETVYPSPPPFRCAKCNKVFQPNAPAQPPTQTRASK